MWGKSFLLLLFIGLFSFSSCKDENEVGVDLLPPGDQLGTEFSDTTTLVSRTIREDSIQTDELSLQLLGSDYDPVYGRVTSSIFTQVVLAGTPSFGINPVADSLVLVMPFNGHYGDTTTTQTVEVFRLSEDLYTDSTYYSDRAFAYDPTALGSISFQPRPKTGIVVGGDTINAQLRIRLDQSLADSLILLGGSSTFSSNANWVSYFKGLHIKASDVAGRGAISYFSFFSSYLVLYFHDSSNTATNYAFSLAGARTTQFTHDYAGSIVGLQLADSTYGDSLNYLQSMAGVKVRISFPYLKHFIDSGSILINRAILKFEAMAPDPSYPLPDKVILLAKDENGQNIFPADYFESSSFFGGTLDPTDNSYSFNIARHLQRHLEGTQVNGDLYFVITGSAVIANRFAFRSSMNSTSPLKLSIYYTKLY